MNGSPSSVLTQGLGLWGAAGLLLTLGYGIGEAVDSTPVACVHLAGVDYSSVSLAGVDNSRITIASDLDPC